MTLEADLPTRAEIESVLDRVTLPAGKQRKFRAARNFHRRQAVEQAFADLPLAPVEMSKLLDDLVSYPQWEPEEEDDDA